MRDWLRRVDPAFYHKEPYLMRARAQIDRFTDEAQAELRLRVLTDDRVLHAATMLVALSAYAAAAVVGTLDAHRDGLTMWALAVLAVAVPRALPWWPRLGVRGWLGDALIGFALIVIPALWTRIDVVVLGVALLTGASLAVARGRAGLVLLVLAAGVLFGARMPARPLFVAPFVAGALAAAAGVLGVRSVGRVWRLRPQVLTWSAFAALLVLFASLFAFEAPAAAQHVPAEIAAIAVAYLGVCIIAGRIRRAELIARPNGVLSLPQSVVPLLDRSHHHAVICWLA